MRLRLQAGRFCLSCRVMSEEMQDTSETKPQKPKGSWDDTIKTLFIAVFVAVLFRSFLFEPFHIPSASMHPTLLEGDYLFVNKMAYGYGRYSFPFGFPLFDGRILSGDDFPERGDVVVFRPPGNPRIDYIKRVIGLPGEIVQVRDSRLYIEGKLVERFAEGSFTAIEGRNKNLAVPIYIETLPNGLEHGTLDYENGRVDPLGFRDIDPDNTDVYRIPEGHYFMMGDNRDNSRDSRYLNGVGMVPLENIVGRADIIFFSVGNGVRIWEIWRWPFAFRTERFLQRINP